eukprot:CAMPEP_0204602912 /NCGR_PEP_ID=MMETSP0661-20131031/56949_1 /ASSEMBLY_ACC=CAM_ASM_000606 /TAXON_ID=109239 /ORGANISM="Alexandrium margalefi, Strain AMGDE01CS-322" /LENGTH=64 /DNA_ID=CAMNT_0051613935 /DNA_START=132 /DNA_END=327 /DNA_ORIENTATION=+
MAAGVGRPKKQVVRPTLDTAAEFEMNAEAPDRSLRRQPCRLGMASRVDRGAPYLHGLLGKMGRA